MRYNFIDMKNIRPQQPSHLSSYARACTDALVKANLADRISLGGNGIVPLPDYRQLMTWMLVVQILTSAKAGVVQALETSLSILAVCAFALG